MSFSYSVKQFKNFKEFLAKAEYPFIRMDMSEAEYEKEYDYYIHNRAINHGLNSAKKVKRFLALKIHLVLSLLINITSLK